MKRLLTLSYLFPTLIFAGPPPTLMEMAGVHPAAARLSESVVLVIDAQREYVDGSLALAGMDRALAEGSRLLHRARAAGAPVIHVVHKGAGPLFNPAGPYFSIAEPMAPAAREPVIEKRLPNAFAGTELEQRLAATGRKHLIVVGFMTHMCVSSTVRAALDLGYATTLVGDATTTRDLPDSSGGTISAQAVQQASLAALADRFAVVVKRADEIPE
ncbi:MAG: cysteine hydrolase family protein [Candidatus Thiodiazotropha sp.]